MKKRNSETVIITLHIYSLFLLQKVGSRRDELPFKSKLVNFKEDLLCLLLLQGSYSLPYLSYLFLYYILDQAITKALSDLNLKLSVSNYLHLSVSGSIAHLLF